MGSHESGEPSTARPTTSTTDSTLAARSSDDVTRSSPSHPPAEEAFRGSRRDERNSHRPQKHRASGAFLLTDALDDGRDHNKSPRRRQPAETQRPKSWAATPEKLSTNILKDTPPRTAGGYDPRQNGEASNESNEADQAVASEDAIQTQDHAAPQLPTMESSLGLDMNATQIVNMALNLSESRRLAAKRNASQPLPPRLTPLPASAVGGSLRQQLQQQRRVSRTISPKPDRGSRLGSGQRVSSPLQAAFEGTHEGSYRYHFSQSTLVRAQRAKEHLELLAQYRRVLDFVPDLKPAAPGKTTGPARTGTGMSAYFSDQDQMPTLGRPYNPLQYIRNRKVRLRERKDIDGDALGFGDTMKVAEWVDGVAKWTATGQNRTPGSAMFPPFMESEEPFLGRSLSTSSRQNVPVAKPKRPRIDWTIAPADLLADIYWLEQDDNKKLVEDRHWRRVFPQDPESYRPVTRRSEDGNMIDSMSGALRSEETGELLPENSTSEFREPPKEEQEYVRSSARERARQKLQDLRGRHHRHSSSIQSHDFTKFRRGSISDSSDTDGDMRKRRQASPLTGGGQSILEKQMQDMIAREARERDNRGSFDSGTLSRKTTNTEPTTAEKLKFRGSPAPHRPHRRDSGANFSESDEASSRSRFGLDSPTKAGRASLEVPNIARRMSTDGESSRPTSPESRPARRGDTGFVPGIGADLSPAASRQSSPTRNPFSKVKRVFRDRSRERGDRFSDEKNGAESAAGQDVAFGTPPTPGRKHSRERKASQSPLRTVIPRGTGDSHKSHRSIGSIRLHREDSSGLRSLFRNGPRIDTVLRSGVSKVSDLLWRNSSNDGIEAESSGLSSDDSDAEATRGRRRGSVQLNRAQSEDTSKQGPRHFLDVMPHFISSSQTKKSSTSLLPDPPSRPSSRRSERFEMLKPPKLDVESASPTTTPPRLIRLDKDSDASDSGSRKSSNNYGSRRASTRLNEVIQRPQMFVPPKPRQFSTATLAGRHFSIVSSKRGGSPTRAPLSKREVARLKALMLSSGILARDISCRAKEPRVLQRPGHGRQVSSSTISSNEGEPSSPNTISWTEIAKLAPSEPDLASRPIASADFYPLASRVLAASIQSSGQQFQAAADAFEAETNPLRRRAEGLRDAGLGAAELTRRAADEADEVSRDLAYSQRLKARRVVEAIEKLHRRRRRRFRWARRAGWLAVEWVLVGFMWYVWFVVMIARVFLGIGEGMFRAVKWLLWL
jgi:hypothetical protein